jgi:hypothetical protein
VDRIRVLMIAMSRLQTDLLGAALAGEPAVRLVGQLDTADAREVARTGADVIVVGHDDGDDPPATIPAPVLDLLDALPRLKVLGVTGGGGRAVLYELRPAARGLGDVSPRALVAAIVELAGPPGRGRGQP